MRKHIVLYRFNESVPHDRIEPIFQLLEDAYKKIPGMVSFSHGVNANNCLQSKGFSHGFVMEFLDTDSLKTYLDHQNHQHVRIKVRELVTSEDDIFEFDYEHL